MYTFKTKGQRPVVHHDADPAIKSVEIVRVKREVPAGNLRQLLTTFDLVFRSACPLRDENQVCEGTKLNYRRRILGENLPEFQDSTALVLRYSTGSG
jgi:hypothetical protein